MNLIKFFRFSALFLLTILFFSCSNSQPVITFESVIFPKNQNLSDDENFLFYIKVINDTNKDLIFNYRGYEKSAENSGFYLINNGFYTGSVFLHPTADADEQTIKSGQSAKLFLTLSMKKLQNILLKNHDDKYSFDDLKVFMKSGNYTLVYISTKPPQTQNVLKSKSFKVIELTSQDTLKRILMP
jgi:hypothetical protein